LRTQKHVFHSSFSINILPQKASAELYWSQGHEQQLIMLTIAYNYNQILSHCNKGEHSELAEL
jgi:hypothetical protein